MTILLPSRRYLLGRWPISFDVAAQGYISAVEAADGQTLETGVKVAINNFIVGCKADGTWNAIKASCILAGARTLSGALVPLAGTAPTNFNFVSGDYDRKTGLVGNGSTKYLNSNRNNNADPQNSKHFALLVSGFPTKSSLYFSCASINVSGDSFIYEQISPVIQSVKNNSSGLGLDYGAPVFAGGFIGTTRASSSAINVRRASTTTSHALASVVPLAETLQVFGTSNAGLYSNARLAFYSIGESLDLALLDARVTALITAFGTAIP